MIVYVAGDTHGDIYSFIENIYKVQKETSLVPSIILHTGNFGVWPTLSNLDKATKSKNLNSINFPKFYKSNTSLPFPTFFVPGKHEDHYFLRKLYLRGQLEILPNLYWLVSGVTYPIGNLKVLGLGKVYSPNTFNSIKIKNLKTRLSHYNKEHVDRCCTQKEVDILLTHQAGKGTNINGRISESEGINEIISASSTTLHIHGSYDYSSYYSGPTGIPTLSLKNQEIRVIDFKNKSFEIVK